MADYDRILIQPSAEELEDAVGEAVAAVNGKARKARLSWPMSDYDAFAAELDRSPEGWKQWNANARASDLRSALGAAWWTDHIGRPHVRLVGCRIGRNLVADLFGPHAAGRPPLWRVYPEFAFVVVRDGRRAVNVLCRCGAAGTPSELGWMGDCCAACHDRREAGSPVPVLWRIATFCPGPHNSRRHFLALSPDGKTLALSQAEQLLLWDVHDGRSLYTLRRSAYLGLLAFAPDGRTLAGWSTLGRLILWDVPTGREVASFPTDRDVLCLAWSPDGALIARGGVRRTLLLEADGGRELLDLSGSVSAVDSLAFSPDGTMFAAGTWSGVLKVCDTRSGEERLTLNCPDYHRLTNIAFSPAWDGSLFPRDGRPVLGAVGFERERLGGTLLLFPPPLGMGGAPLAPVTNAHGTLAGAFSPDGRLFLTGSLDGTMRVWSLPEAREVAVIEWHQNQVGHLTFSADGQCLMTAGFPDGVVRLWPWESLRAVLGTRGAGREVERSVTGVRLQ